MFLFWTKVAKLLILCQKIYQNQQIAKFFDGTKTNCGQTNISQTWSGHMLEIVLHLNKMLSQELCKPYTKSHKFRFKFKHKGANPATFADFEYISMKSSQIKYLVLRRNNANL